VSLSLAAFSLHNPAVVSLLTVTANLNAWIVLFNLIPFGMLDGLKIFSWNKRVWTVAFAVSIALMAAIYWLNTLI
jgi:Zn-dependent protease